MATIEEERRQSLQAAEALSSPQYPVKKYGVYSPPKEKGGNSTLWGKWDDNNRWNAQKRPSPLMPERDIVGPPPPESLEDNRRNGAIRDIYERLLEQENGKNLPGGGWNEEEQRWYPHKSVEGGADTIAYGIKLSNGSKWAELAKKQGYLTDEQANQAAQEMSADAYESAKKTYNKHIKDTRRVDNAWGKLNSKQRSILADYAYQNLLGKFANLMDATYSGDIEGMKQESARNTGGRPLTKRNERMIRDIDSLLTDYPIIPGE